MEALEREQITTSTRLAGQVERYHTWPTITRQTVGEHTWQVMRIYTEIFGMPTQDVWLYILHHDTPEVAIGDPPFPVKARNPNLKAAYDALETQAYESMGIEMPELTDWQKKSVKVCDLLEMWEFGRYEMALGNRLASPIVVNTMEAVGTLSVDLHESDQLAIRGWIGAREEDYLER